MGHNRRKKMVGLDFVGRIGNTPLSARHGLIPLYETIFNSIQAIEEANIENGLIEIEVIRDTSGLLLDDIEILKTAPISGFVVKDNGIGFNEENFLSFSTSDTRKKRNIGGKGVGRFLWLNAFDKVNVNSTYRNNGEIRKRTFDFVLKPDPIENISDIELPSNYRIETIVSLQYLKQNFAEYFPKQLETITYRIIEHCLEYFVLKRIPLITIKDENQEIIINNEFNKLIGENSEDELRINNQILKITHFLMTYQAGMTNKLNYCAAHRVVFEKKLDSKVIPNLPNKIASADENEHVIYLAYLSGDFLDNHVNQDRTNFNIFEESGFKFIGDLDWNELEKAAYASISKFLGPVTKPLAENKLEKIKKKIDEDSPQFKPLLKYKKEGIDQIPPDISSDKLDIELFKLQQEWDREVKEKAQNIISNEDKFKLENNEIKDRYFEFLKEFNENGKSNLAKYVVHRKTTLEILEKHMKKTDDNKFALEKTIHELIFPLRKTSDDISYEEQNLWIIDEKLAFHSYIASDKSLKNTNGIASIDIDRPDLIMFDRPIAIANDQPINGITIFEFKRPMRDDNDPISQMLLYVRKIRDGKETTNKERPLRVSLETPFYCYAVCDLTKKMEEKLIDRGSTKTPDHLGFFDYNKNLNAYIEVISYDKLLIDAKQRNRILFDKLNLPTS